MPSLQCAPSVANGAGSPVGRWVAPIEWSSSWTVTCLFQEGYTGQLWSPVMIADVVLFRFLFEALLVE
jgi:hypothetical protein